MCTSSVVSMHTYVRTFYIRIKDAPYRADSLRGSRRLCKASEKRVGLGSQVVMVMTIIIVNDGKQ